MTRLSENTWHGRLLLKKVIGTIRDHNGAKTTQRGVYLCYDSRDNKHVILRGSDLHRRIHKESYLQTAVVDTCNIRRMDRSRERVDYYISTFEFGRSGQATRKDDRDCIKIIQSLQKEWPGYDFELANCVRK